MSNILCCERCDKLFKEGDITHGIISGLWLEDMEIDLCDDCRSDLDDWLHPESAKAIKEYIKKGKKKTTQKKNKQSVN